MPPRAAHTAARRARPIFAPAVGTRFARAVPARAAEAPAGSTDDAVEDVRESEPSDRRRALVPSPRASRRAMLAAPPALSLGLGLGAMAFSAPASARTSAALASVSPAKLPPPPPFASVGVETLRDPALYNGLATADRAKRGLDGLLPVATTTPDIEVARASAAVDACESPMTKYRQLVSLLNTDERTFYSLLEQRTADLLPILYTPTVGDACLQYGTLTQRPPGITVSLNDAGNVPNLLASWPKRDVRVAVITDGERILGLGDLGANGMGISAGKSMVYAACGLRPEWLLPIQVDTGTNNETLLNDPLYVGDRRVRRRGETYDALLEELVFSLQARYGRNVLIHFEDFAPRNAFRVLQKFRTTSSLVINDDIQGTAAVTVAGAVTACRAVDQKLTEQRVLFFGAGQANVGAANLLTLAMTEADPSLSVEDARKRIWLVDSKGLVYDGRPADGGSLSPDKAPFAANLAELRSAFSRPNKKNLDPTSLADVVAATRCSMLVGAAAIPGAFSESVVRQMAKQNDRPIIFALSNPTSKAECTAAQAYEWSGGRAVFASGTKFPDQAVRDGKTGATEQRRPGFANNAFIFPGVALGSLASGASTVTDKMFLAAALALASLVTEEDLEKGAVYPPTSTIRQAAFFVGAGVAAAAAEENVARPGACAGGAIPAAGGKAVPSLDAAPGENDAACVNWEACVRDYAKTCL